MLRVEENFTPIFPGERGPLFAASVKLFQFALRASSASASDKGLTEDEGALLQAIRPLVTNPDCHFFAVLTALVQSILEGRTDCPISGVFGAGKTRAAAAMIAGLLTGSQCLRVYLALDFPYLKANIANTNLYPPLTCDLHTGSGIGASTWFHQSHLLSMLVVLLWHRGCLSDITGAFFCCPGTLSGWFLVSSLVCCI